MKMHLFGIYLVLIGISFYTCCMNDSKNISSELIKKEIQASNESWLAQFCNCWETEIFRFWYSAYKDPVVNSVTKFISSDEDKAHDALDLIILYASQYKIPFSVAIESYECSYDLRAILTKKGFNREITSGMVCYLDEISSAEISENIQLVHKNTVSKWIDVFNTVFGEYDSKFTESYTDLIFKNLEDQKNAEYYAGYLDDDLVTIGTLFLYKNYGLICNIATHPNARKKGLATMMMTTLIQRAKKLGLHHLLLTTHDSQKLYAKTGFKEIMDVEEYVYTF